jgi:hypothetical protein
MRKLFGQITGYVAERSGLMLRTAPGGPARCWSRTGCIGPGSRWASSPRAGSCC